MLVFSPSNSGKSNVIKNLICRPEFGYKDYYDSNIFIISQTIHMDPIWKDIDIPKAHLYDTYTDALVTNLMHYSKRSKNGILLILDDMITSDVAVNNKNDNLLKTLFFQGRHYKMSLVLVSQKLKAIPLCLRINASHLICFNLNNRREEHDFFEENCGIDEIVAKYRVATATKYNFLYVDKTSGQAYHNFETLLN
jgi:hypothetical protein